MTSIINVKEKKKITAMFAKKWGNTKTEVLDNLTLSEIIYALRHYSLRNLEERDFGLAYRLFNQSLANLETLEKCAEIE